MWVLSPSTPFVGRATQLRALVSAVQAADRGEGAVSFVAGEAGIGKTRLLREVCAQIDRPVLWSGCQPDAPAFWPWRQVIHRLRVKQPSLWDECDAAYADDLAVLLGDVESIDSSSGARFRLFDSVVGLLAGASDGRRLAVVLDDLHWADEASIRLLQFFGRDVRTGSVAVIGAYRDTEVPVDHPLAQCLADLAIGGVHISLGGLGPRDIATLAGTLTDRDEVAPETVAQLYRQTNGNPFFLYELLCLEGDVPVGSVPSSIRAVIGRRLDAFSASTRVILRALAALGGAADLPTVAATAAVTGADVMTAIACASTSGLVRDGPEGPQFVHDLVREEVRIDGCDRAQCLHSWPQSTAKVLLSSNYDSSWLLSPLDVGLWAPHRRRQ
jgi:hypothetical protein